MLQCSINALPRAQLSFPKDWNTNNVTKPMLAVLADRFSFSGNAGQLFPLSPALIKTEVLSGLTVALAMVP